MGVLTSFSLCPSFAGWPIVSKGTMHARTHLIYFLFSTIKSLHRERQLSSGPVAGRPECRAEEGGSMRVGVGAKCAVMQWHVEGSHLSCFEVERVPFQGIPAHGRSDFLKWR